MNANMFFLIDVLHGTVPKLERYIILTITANVIVDLAQEIGPVMNVGVRVDWMDRIL